MSGIAYAGLGEAPKTADGAVKLYDEWADSYDETLRSWGYEAPDQVLRLLKERVGADAKVLDLGCGTGMSGIVLSKGGLTGQHVGVDISPKSIEAAGKLDCYSGGAFVGSLEEPFKAEVTEKGPFDAVICVGVLSYVHKFDLFWKECLNVLKPGGFVVVTHRPELWGDDVDECNTAAAKLIVAKEWFLELATEPMPYMPKNPDPVENRKRIQYLVFRKAGGDTGAKRLKLE